MDAVRTPKPTPSPSFDLDASNTDFGHDGPVPEAHDYGFLESVRRFLADIWNWRWPSTKPNPTDSDYTSSLPLRRINQDNTELDSEVYSEYESFTLEPSAVELELSQGGAVGRAPEPLERPEILDMAGQDKKSVSTAQGKVAGVY